MEHRLWALPDVRAAALFVVVNLLNLMDAVLTDVALDLGVATEANPVIDTIGFGGKLALVAAASAALAMVRPKALWIPMAALAAVVAYTATGLLLSA